MELGGAGGAVWTQRLMIAALVVIIAGSVATTVYSCFRPEEGSAVQPDKLHYKCGKCGHPFVKTYEELSAEAAKDEAADEEDPRFMLDCPACKAKRCCAQMVSCPECGEHFVPFEFARSRTDPDAVAAGKDNDICPHCKTDRREWLRKDYERRKQQN